MSEKQATMDKYDIEFKLKIDIAPEIAELSAEVCALISNALDNAIEACLKSDSERVITAEINSNKTRFLCYIKNTIGETPAYDGQFLRTSKNESGHGIGLRSMRYTCDRLGGKIKFKFDNEYFELWISLPI
jgi:sensor histidine kinase regulating citrate/malate metabolism